MTAPVMDLSTRAPERLTVRIDGRAYELVAERDLSAIDAHVIARAHRRIGELEQIDDWAEPHAAEHAALVERIARLVAPSVPSDVLQKVGPAGRIAIVEVFLGSRLIERVRLGLMGLGIAAIASRQGLAPLPSRPTTDAEVD